MNIESKEALREIYGFARGRAKQKQLESLEQHTRHFIKTSPFVLISTVNSAGKLDCSPRGGNRGFVEIIDDHRFIIPDSKGNNRLDSLTNIIETKRVGCIFLIPGVDETLRINGSAALSVLPAYLQRFSAERNPPKCVIEVSIDEVFLHCAKAFMRSRLWSSESKIERSSFPTMGQMLNDQLGDSSEPENQQSMVERYQENL